ncbi:thioredoxin family protein [Mameliella sediminis]|uniref:thioredoxin family protein n=1 Tax=Mameliella sediminis TaxID=2836866 RepID=UPI001C454BFD|nr:thioredoxin family protein [Mameliella sediminis]MBV7394317.1 thioredoxin family protein [Mameliella sediminis]
MDRRTFLALSAGAATAALPLAAIAAPLAYTPGLVTKHLNKGDTVFLDFKASWCTTCAAQERVLKALKDADASYEANVTFIDVDWDDPASASLIKSLKIPRRSTLVVLKGDQELGRIVAQTSRASIKGLMDTALGAATA